MSRLHPINWGVRTWVSFVVIVGGWGLLGGVL